MNPFSLLIKPTSAHCNLQCAYCFYCDVSDIYGVTAGGMMSPETLELLISSYQRLPFNPAQYSYAWQGGEPTLAGLDFFKLAIFFQQKYGFTGAGVSNAIQTNGMLIDDEWASFFAEYNFLTGLSMDGPPDIHDLYRRKRDGGPSHERVKESAEILTRNHAEFNILCLVSQSNVHHPKKVFDYFVENGYNWIQFIPCVEVDEKGKLLPFAISGEEWGDFLIGIFDAWYPHRHTVSVRLFDALLARLTYDHCIICHLGTDCRQYFVVEHNGDVFPCDFFVRKEHKIGHLGMESWKGMLASEKYAQFGCQKNQYAGKCKYCKHVQICQGDCMKHRILPPHNDAKQMSYLCEGWKRFYDYTLPKFRKMTAEVRERQAQFGRS